MSGMFDRKRLAVVADLHEPAGEDPIRAAERSLALVFPDEYVELLLLTDGLEPTVNRGHYDIGLFHVHELVEYGEAYEVARYLPGYLFIGLDGGGRGLFLRCGGQRSPVFLCGMGALDESELRELAPNLGSWIENDFDLGDPPQVELPERVDIFLLRPPKGGARGLLRICKRLRLTVPISKLRDILASLPHRLCHDVPFLPYARYAKEINEQDPCLEVVVVDHPEQPVEDFV